ncbi:MAG: hybrid sensor histidine kinase/response regulator [Acidobacteriota bacterium]|nr:hybrid sensor histidine kinase/response regulator [Acidobacteriota bacterium]
MPYDKTPRILIADGKVVARRLYTKLLQQFFPDDLDIMECESGIKAVILCDRKEIDCALVSYNLPDFNAVEFLSRLRERLGTHAFVSVLIIAETEEDEKGAIEAMKLGAFDFLVKGKFSRLSLAQSVKNAVENARLRSELAQSQQRILDTAHRAGMAEIANGVLHNIGNNLNSLNIALDSLQDTAENTRLSGLQRANQLLADMSDLLSQHPKGSGLIQYYQGLEEAFQRENEVILAEVAKVREKINHIRNDVSEQTRYANAELFLEDLDLNTVVKEVINLQQGRLEEGGIEVRTNCNKLPRCKVVRIKLLQILNNLIKNSIESLGDNDVGDRTLIIGTRPDEDEQYAITVTDNGPGISEDNFDKIFHYGYTTKENANGTGLHMAANAAGEMGGRITAANTQDRGCTFTLVMPFVAATPGPS